MSYRNLAGIDEKILRAIWQLGAANGVKKITARKVGALCGVSDYTVFYHFGSNNRGFLDAAAKHFFSLCVEPILDCIAHGAVVGALWDETLDRFLAEPDGALYFQSYCAAYGLSDAIFPAQRRLDVAAALTRSKPALSEGERLLLLDFFFSNAHHFVEGISRGSAENTDETRAFLRALICRAFEDA